MKKISDVCKIVGVTRRTLQEYDKIGLLKPTSKTNSGYWLYDDEAIVTLWIIQIFVEGGYKRKKIKAILESQKCDLMEEYKHLIESLESKKNRIENLIKFVQYSIFSLDKCSNRVYRALNRKLPSLNPSSFSGKNSWHSDMESFLSEDFSDINENEEKIIGLMQNLMWSLMAVGTYFGTSPDKKEVQDLIGEVFQIAKETVRVIEIEDGEDIGESSKEKLSEILEEFIEDMKDSDGQFIIDKNYGQGATEYVLQAIQIYSKNRKEQ